MAAGFLGPSGRFWVAGFSTAFQTVPTPVAP
jgi:hypothetical protein